ncbi:YlaH-like family protein [Solibacillus sp. A46]|uniref:YlaH-like family protein n=2 Tax=Solibacillus faecavium TaxID=2762221 RepID=A0ABR8XUE3_9BACL|nr:YlaH-like family protein [Solibacillus faecavium]MBD8035571.1 YlaH-like family protein [Solibacillus faecavium]
MMLAVLSSYLNLVLLASVSSSENEYVFNRMSGITSYLYQNLPNYDMAGYVTFILVFLMSAIVYKLGFAKKLTLGRNIVIYTFLFFGCIVLTFLALFLPMIEGLIVAALILIVYKSRLWREKREEAKQAN